MTDPDCICQGNWRLLVKEYEPLFNRQYRSDRNGQTYTFVRLLHAERDYYYLMWNKESTELLSCVGNIDGFGYTLIEENDDEDRDDDR